MPAGRLVDAPLRLETPDPVHEDKVAAIIGQIHAGDLFQANLARGWTGRLRPRQTPADVMAALQAAGAAPFGAYVDLGPQRSGPWKYCPYDRFQPAPRRFIRLDRDGGLETRPIKEDAAARSQRRTKTPPWRARSLASVQAIRAENLMIVDLMRHDLAKVARVGSVAVPSLNALESYPNVHHLVSTVTAQLEAGRTAADLLLATLPPGSVSGAPKVQAMKVIAAMEAARSGPCSLLRGALFTVDAGGAMESVWC